MWMQKSVEGSGFSSSGNFHDRNRFGSPYASGGSYGGDSAVAEGAGDWKSKILESGQWLGGKVIEYGGKLARGPTSDSIPDHYAPQMPRNDGRANWMADIRSSSGGGTGGYTGGYSGNGGGGYQNDFATERPKAYSDFGNKPKPYEPKSLSSVDHEHHHKSRHVKKKSRKSKKKKQQSESESEAELSISESSETESADERQKRKAKAKKKTKKHSGFYSESESSDDGGKKKTSADYAFSFDPAQLPPPPVEEKKKSKAKKSKKEKSKKARARQHSVVSTDDESTSEKENSRKAKKRGSKKAASSASVDLLGVDLVVQQVAQPTTGRSSQEVQPSIFDAPLNQNPLQDLAGLSFAAAPAQAPAPMQPSIFHAASNETHEQEEVFHTNLLPENNIVDLSSLASEKKNLSANPEEKRTLNDLQKARGADQPTPVMAMPMQGQPQMQNMPGGMMQNMPMQLSMNMHQLQLTNSSTDMQQQMYPNMQMQGMSQQQMQRQQIMMMQQQQHQMMMMQQQQQQFAQGTASMTRPSGSQPISGASKPNSSDPFHQI